jgi:sporulation protein YlmC with PRC-barrel domain
MTDIDLGLGILDHQLIDAEGRRCGKVDDLEIEGVREGRPAVAAILTGPAGWRRRGLLGRLAARIAGGRSVTISWDDVARVGAAVELKRTAAELGLARGEERARGWVEKFPGSSL